MADTIESALYLASIEATWREVPTPTDNTEVFKIVAHQDGTVTTNDVVFN